MMNISLSVDLPITSQPFRREKLVREVMRDWRPFSSHSLQMLPSLFPSSLFPLFVPFSSSGK